MRYLKKINESLNNIDSICKRYGIINYTINNDGSIDVFSNVDLAYRGLSKLPLKFGSVGGYFNCQNNQLTSLKGAPRSVGRGFYCQNNQLTSLWGSSKSVGGHFYCYNNQLISLRGAPESVVGNFYCYNNHLTSLEGAPKSVDGHFYCQNNQLTSLRGAPKSVGGIFYCDGNPVESIWNLFKDYSKIDILNDYDVIRDDKVILDRLNDFLIHIGKPPVSKVDGYINI